MLSRTFYSPNLCYRNTIYDNATSRPKTETFSVPSDHNYDINSTYTYKGDICTLKSTQMNNGDRVETTHVYTTDATGTEILKELSKDVCIYDGNSNMLKEGTNWYLTDSDILIVITSERFDDENLQTISRTYKKDITEYRDDPSFISTDNLLTERTTAISRQDGTCISTTYEHGPGLKDCDMTTFDEYENILSITKQENKEGKVVVSEDKYIYSGEGRDKVLTGRTSSRKEDSVLVSTQNSKFSLEGDKYICDNVLISYTNGTDRNRRTETRFEIINGESIFTMNDKEDMRVWWAKSYKYYPVLDDIDNYHYRLTASQEYEYGLSTSNIYSKLTETEYTYNDSSVEGYNAKYTVTTTTRNEDGTVSIDYSADFGFTPEKDKHLFTESISD